MSKKLIEQFSYAEIGFDYSHTGTYKFYNPFTDETKNLTKKQLKEKTNEIIKQLTNKENNNEKI